MSPDANGPAYQELPPNSQFGPYRIARLLGRGGMGAVYEAEHIADGRMVALKLLSVDLDKLDARERFLREGRTAAAINHPNAVYIYGTEEIEGTPAITMEIVPGGTLDEKIKERGPLPWQEAVDDILQVIDGLDAAYAAGILHRDVKPSNCFVGTAGNVKIGDFGLSKPIDGGEQQKLTQTGLFIGTPVFSSPEQLLGETLDVRSDIYAVGVTFYSLLTGVLPFQSGSMMQVVASVLNGAPAPITNYRKDLPPAVVAVVLKALARKASDRFQSYEEFRAAVAGLRAETVVPATLWDRARASLVDWVVNLGILWVISLLFLPGLFSASSSRSANWHAVVLSVSITLLIVGIPEALRGASIGKWLVGIRVIDANGNPPWFAREAGRILILAISDLSTFFIQTSSSDQGMKSLAALASMLVFRGVLFTSVRRKNGWRMLHDFATGTRVVRPQAAQAQRRGETHNVVEPSLAGTEQRVGPYAIVEGEASTPGVLRGWDATMKRAVWIVRRSEHDAEATAARRTLARLTRLRWVGGRREPGDAWDAYEAPAGEPLSARLKRPVSWAVQQNWLLDVSNEFGAAATDGTALTSQSADDLWVTPSDRLVFPERVIPSADAQLPGSLVPALTAPVVVTQLFDRIAAAAPGREPMPLHAARTIAAARKVGTPSEIVSLVQSVAGRPLTVTRMRRVGLLVATVGPILLLSAIGWFTTSRAIRADNEGFLMSGLLSFVGDSMASMPDSVRARAEFAAAHMTAKRRVNLALERLHVLNSTETDTLTPRDTLRNQRRLAEAYLSTVLRARMRDSTKTSSFGNTPKERRRQAAILARNVSVDSAVAREARRLVDSVWKQNVPGNGSSVIVRYVPIILAISILVVAAMVSVAAGVLVRRGPMLRAFQVDIVTRQGLPAGRLRLLVRNVVIWSALLVPVLILLIAQFLSIPALATAMVASLALFLVGWVGAIAYAVLRPSRGFGEIVSGTWMVPE